MTTQSISNQERKSGKKIIADTLSRALIGQQAAEAQSACAQSQEFESVDVAGMSMQSEFEEALESIRLVNDVPLPECQLERLQSETGKDEVFQANY